MARSASPSSGLAALLAVLLVACATGPAAAAAADALSDGTRSHCGRVGLETPTDEAPAETPVAPVSCCVGAPEAPRDAVVPAPSPVPEAAVTAAFVALAPPIVAPVSPPPPRDTGPPPGPRLHLALSVLLV